MVTPTNSPLTNDTDPPCWERREKNNLPLAFDVLTHPENGTLTTVGLDGFFYDPDPDFFGMDTFEYEVTDALGAASIGVVTITVTEENDAPVPENDFELTVEAMAITIDVLSNDLAGAAERKPAKR